MSTEETSQNPEDEIAEKFVRPGRGRYLTNHAAAFITLVANILIYRLCAQGLGDQAFNEYAVGKRTLSYGLTFMTTGIGYTMSHHVASCSAGEEEGDGAYLLTGTALMLASMAPLFLLVALFPQQVAFLFFGNGARQELALPLAVALLGSSALNVCNSFLFGKMEFTKSAWVIVLGGGLLPLAVVLLVETSAAAIFLWQGIGAVVIALISYFLFLRPLVAQRVSSRSVWRSAAGKFLAYGLPRVPGAFAVTALLALPVTLAAHQTEDLAVAGVLSLGGTILTLVGVAVDPFSRVLLPQSSALVAAGRGHELRKPILRFSAGMILVLTPFLVVVGLFIKPLIAAFLNPELASHAGIILWLLPACLPYAFFRCFRGIVDGAFKSALNTRFSLLSLAAFGLWALLAYGLGWPQPALQGHLVGQLVLGGLTFWKVWELANRS